MKKQTKKQKEQQRMHIALFIAAAVAFGAVGCASVFVPYDIADVQVQRVSTYTFVEVAEAEELDVVDFPGVIREVSAYNVGDPAQTDDTPCIGATGEDLCELVAKGELICAANFVPFGTKLMVDKVGVCTVKDRMNARYQNTVDIAMPLEEKDRALKFGRQNLLVAEM